MTLLGLILWLIHQSRVTPKAINRTKITLDLTRFQTLPPKAPASHPKPRPKALPPRPKPMPPKPKRAQPAPKPILRPKPKPRPAAKNPEKKIARGEEQKRIQKTDENLTQNKGEKNSKKIVIKMTEKKPAPPRKKIATTPKRSKALPQKRRPKQFSRPRKPTQQRKSRRAVRHVPTGPASRLIKRLYGSSYSRMSSTQRKFVDENLRRILQISQQTLNYLGYPQEAARFGEQGTNIVQFYLHPNGDISGLRLLRRTGSTSLDRQTIEVIKTAYMHYPRPKTTTKIIIYVRYRLY
ncbi:TonB family protein [Nitratifractor salsuginis DSM 16511]|uniref:TonB family protein n=2 Tax=Nitratifractor salsuginis TaxID=269261 RepID=E6X202_NITSE|nr:TonB family protein [Nitratifractor salsuginis DSM 16511]